MNMNKNTHSLSIIENKINNYSIQVLISTKIQNEKQYAVFVFHVSKEKNLMSK